MSIAVIEAALKAWLLPLASTWPVLWLNEVWPESIPTSDGNAPLNPDGTPRPFIEAAVIGGSDEGDIALAGQRHSRRFGTLRVYLAVGQGTGVAALNVRTDAIAAGFKRMTVFTNSGVGQRLITMDARIDDGVAGHEDGDRFVRMLSIPFMFDYYS